MVTKNSYYVLVFAIFCCTQSNGSKVLSRIVGGQNANGSEYSFMVSLRYISPENHFCGGSIISSYHVLTAAHCLFHETSKPLNVSHLYVVAGNTKLSSRRAFSSTVNKTYIHEKFNIQNNTENDIAILKLNYPFPFGFQLFNLSMIPLADKEMKNGTNCSIAGWGYDKFENGSLTDNLQSANVTLLDFESCKRLYSAGKIYLMDDVICAGDHVSDSCQGDSGGPLVCNNTLVGITASGVECANPRYPGIYTDVYKNRVWIQKIVANDTNTTNHQNFPPMMPFLPPMVPPLWSNNNNGANHGNFYNNSFSNSTWNGTQLYNNNTFKPGYYPGNIPSFFPTKKPGRNSSGFFVVNKYLFVVAMLSIVIFLN